MCYIIVYTVTSVAFVSSGGFDWKSTIIMIYLSEKVVALVNRYSSNAIQEIFPRWLI